MKRLILSDLHLDFAGYTPSAGVLDSADAVILAGDIMPSARKLPAWASRLSIFGSQKAIIIVPGNHECYGGRLEARRQELLEASAQHSTVHILDPGVLILDGGRIRVLGCTLWTDFCLPIDTPNGPTSDQARAIATAAERMNDYRRITVTNVGAAETIGRSGRRASDVRSFSLHDALALHEAERARRLSRLKERFASKTVVVTITALRSARSRRGGRVTGCRHRSGANYRTSSFAFRPSGYTGTRTTVASTSAAAPVLSATPAAT